MESESAGLAKAPRVRNQIGWKQRPNTALDFIGGGRSSAEDISCFEMVAEQSTESASVSTWKPAIWKPAGTALAGADDRPLIPLISHGGERSRKISLTSRLSFRAF
jgi:hypothetical protein